MKLKLLDMIKQKKIFFSSFHNDEFEQKSSDNKELYTNR
jgi:hypothetical protein